MTEVIQLLSDDEIKRREYRRYSEDEVPDLFLFAAIDEAFSPGKSLDKLIESEMTAFTDLANMHAKMPKHLADKLIEDCTEWWREMKRVDALIRELALEDFRKQGVVV